MNRIFALTLLLLPTVFYGQNTNTKSYQEGLDACKKIVQENQKKNPDKFIYTGPDCMIGATMPQFIGTTFEGRQVSPDYFRGKITVLNFWQISCPPCIAEIPGFNAVIDKYGHDRFNYLAIGLDDADDINRFLKNHPWGFSQLSNGSKMIFDVFKMGWGFPTTFVINEDGVIVAAFSGGKTDDNASEELEDKLTKIIEGLIKK